MKILMINWTIINIKIDRALELYNLPSEKFKCMNDENALENPHDGQLYPKMFL